MSILTQASRQWAVRPDDERFVSLVDMQQHLAQVRDQSRASILSSKRISAYPDEDNKGLHIVTDHGMYTPTNWSFNQISQLAKGRAAYFRQLPSPLVADCVNYGLQFLRDQEDVGVLVQENGERVLRAATGPGYGRIWNSTIVDSLVHRFGDGVSGYWKVPGEFGKDVAVTKANTTLFASDRDMFVFLADEKNRIEVPNRRDGKSGSMARGFFVWNSEVGKTTFGIGTFLFDYVCCNRIVWGAEQYKEIKIRHTSGAPDRFIAEVVPALEVYAESSSQPIVDAIQAAQKKKLDDVDTFLAKRFGTRMVDSLKLVHQAEENRPIETVWDVTTAVTAMARKVPHQDERVEMERVGGDLLRMVS